MKKFGIIFTVTLFFLLGVSLWKFFTAVPPQFFPLNNPQGGYIITKQCPVQGWNASPVQNREIYCVTYKGEGVVSDGLNSTNNFFSVTVGKTSIDLQPFEDKPVMIIQGKFVSATMQCVQNVCKNIDGPLVVLNIDELKLVN